MFGDAASCTWSSAHLQYLRPQLRPSADDCLICSFALHPCLVSTPFYLNQGNSCFEVNSNPAISFIAQYLRSNNKKIYQLWVTQKHVLFSKQIKLSRSSSSTEQRWVSTQERTASKHVIKSQLYHNPLHKQRGVQQDRWHFWDTCSPFILAIFMTATCQSNISKAENTHETS